MRIIRTIMSGLIATVALSGQSSPPRAEFEVASIRPSAQGGDQVNVGVHVDGAQVNIRYLSLRDYIRAAYRIKEYQVSGPEWVSSERFDVSAKLPAGAKQDQVPEMLQSLLADRFKMKTHDDTKEFPVYGLVVAKGGSKMKESPADPEAAGRDAAKEPVNVSAIGGRGGTSINFGHGASFSLTNDRFDVQKLTMVQLADTLSRFMDRPVVDMTGLPGRYDFSFSLPEEQVRILMIQGAVTAGISLPPQALRLLDNASNDAFYNALETVGLKIENRKAPLKVLVIDHMEKTPVEN